MELHELAPAKGAVKKSNRHFRGSKTCGKGHKGQNSRSGGGVRPGFEGGQMPIYRRLPKVGFNNVRFANDYVSVNVERLEKFEDGTVVTAELMKEAGIVSKIRDGIVIIGRGELTKKLTVQAKRFSKTAQEKIEKAGGKAEVV
jgi:large subunit ribosomal protein L15